MTDQEYLSKALQIIKDYDLQHYVDSLLSYWQKNPTTLGHGFEHVVKAAVECYLLAEENGYDKLAEIFLGGLLHDVYRPVEGKAAKEDHHEECATILNELFSKDTKISYLVDYLTTEEEWRGKRILPPDGYKLYLFIGERATHTSLLTNNYVWASNKFAKDHGQDLKYKDHQTAIYHFFYYHLEVWDVFIKAQHLKGIERGMDSYLEVVHTASNNYQNDRKGEHFLEYLEEQAKICRKKEIFYLEGFGMDHDQIDLIMKNMY
jgi:hypothetical protein